MGMDHSALIPLRSKNFRERSDAHFVDVIKEDRLVTINHNVKLIRMSVSVLRYLIETLKIPTEYNSHRVSSVPVTAS